MTSAYFSPSPFYRRDPVAHMLDDFLGGFLVRPVSAAPAAAAHGFKFDVREAGNTYVVEADLPGLSKDAIKIEIDGAQVSISAQYAAYQVDTAAAAGTVDKSGAASAAGSASTGGEAGQTRVVYRERSTGAVARSFELPAEIDQDAASAQYEDGVLRLTLPKKIAETRKLLAIH